ncbi:MAG: DNA primase [Rhodothermales bacterium]|nr:DNA primase [Rhodothermales bacterium]
MHIPENIIEDVRAASDIVDVDSDYVRLKKRGSNFVGLCPFHNEKTPSFNVNPRMQIYKCFGCSAGGDVFQFVKQVEKSEFPEAVRLLAARANIDIPEPDQDPSQTSEAESIHFALRFAARFFHDALLKSDEAAPARSYLEHRGMTEAAIRKFGVGFSPDSWEGLRRAANDASVSDDVLLKAGLVISRNEGEGYYDRFRGRIMFPILSHVGKVLGFGGRILHPESDQPKYINSPETKVYHKSRVLYGLYQARQEIRRHEEVFLVEGYTDVVSLHQVGVENVVASSGTALAQEQIALLERYCKKIVLLFDADSAGANAAVRGIDLILGSGMAVYVVTLPEGEDPDSYARSAGGDAFREYGREHRKDFVQFKYDYGRQVLDDSPESVARLQRGVLQSIAVIDDPLLQETYLKRASAVMGVPDIRLHEALAGIRAGSRRRRGARAQSMPAGDSVGPSHQATSLDESGAIAAVEPLPEEKTLLRLMLGHGAPLVEFILSHMALNEFTEGPSREIASALMQMFEAGRVDRDRVLDGSYGDEARELAAEVLVGTIEASKNWAKKQNIRVPLLDEDSHESASSAMTLLKLDRVDDAIVRMRARIYTRVEEGGDVRAAQEELMKLVNIRRSIESREFLSGHGAKA